MNYQECKDQEFISPDEFYNNTREFYLDFRLLELNDIIKKMRKDWGEGQGMPHYEAESLWDEMEAIRDVQKERNVISWVPVLYQWDGNKLQPGPDYRQ